MFLLLLCFYSSVSSYIFPTLDDYYADIKECGCTHEYIYASNLFQQCNVIYLDANVNVSDWAVQVLLPPRKRCNEKCDARYNEYKTNKVDAALCAHKIDGNDVVSYLCSERHSAFIPVYCNQSGELHKSILFYSNTFHSRWKIFYAEVDKF